MKKKDSQPASRRLAAHQSGRAIAAVASKFDGSLRGVKYVVTFGRGLGRGLEVPSHPSYALFPSSSPKGRREKSSTRLFTDPSRGVRTERLPAPSVYVRLTFRNLQYFS